MQVWLPAGGYPGVFSMLNLLQWVAATWSRYLYVSQPSITGDMAPHNTAGWPDIIVSSRQEGQHDSDDK